MSKLVHKELSDIIVGIAFKVHNAIGAGLKETVYQSAFCLQLSKCGLHFEQEKHFPVLFENEQVGYYLADIVVENTIILELKAVSDFHPSMYAQVINYLRISGLPVGYLINFSGSRVKFKRFVNLKE